MRVPLPKSVRFNVFKRDLFCCQYCGRHPPDVTLEVDHITPVAAGGTNVEENLIAACFECNRGKAAVPLTVVPMSLAMKGAEVAEREAQLAGYREIMEARADRIRQDAFDIAGILLLVDEGANFSVDRRWLRSIRTFNERLPLHVVKEAAELAVTAGIRSEYKRFLYFCKVCWNKIKGAAQ